MIVTIDAMGCQTEIASKTIDGGGFRVDGRGWAEQAHVTPAVPEGGRPGHERIFAKAEDLTRGVAG